MRSPPLAAVTLLVSLLACAGGPDTVRPGTRDPAVSPAVRSAVEALRPDLARLTGEATMTVAVVMAERLVWTEAFGRPLSGPPPRADDRYDLNALTDLIATAAALRAGAAGAGGDPLPPDRLPPPEEWSCRTLAPLWGDEAARAPWPAPADAILARAGALRVERSEECDGWRASAPELARIGAVLMDGVTLGDREATWLMRGQPVRLAAATGDEGGAALLLDRASNMSIAVMTDRAGPHGTDTAAAAARTVHAAFLDRLAPDPTDRRP